MDVKRIVLDTNCYGAFLAGDGKVLDCLAAAEVVFMSVVVLGELRAGFKGGSRERENLAMLASFLEKPTVRVLNVTEETAEVFGTLKSRLKKAGTPIPINDVWLAAQAVETGAVLVTYDGHFTKVAGLRTWRRREDR